MPRFGELSLSRSGHVVMDVETRRLKAIKIERLLQLDLGKQPIRLLEVGTGSGGIAHYFATHPSGRYDVDAVDVKDSRLISDAYKYTSVLDANLPFEDESFDVVLSNHVIEHVGDELEQMRHLTELRRVLRPTGVGYLAVPNRWMLVEPHYRLRFLSWLPRELRTPYLRFRGKGDFYDCEPLQQRQLESMLRELNLDSRNLCVRAMRLAMEIERPTSTAARVLARVPDFLIEPLRAAIPTLIYTFRRKAA